MRYYRKATSKREHQSASVEVSHNHRNPETFLD